MGRKRGGRFSDRPRNVQLSTKAGTTYFQYQFPDGRRASLGADRADAYAKADALNGHFATQRVCIESLIAPRPALATARNPQLRTLVQDFERHVLKSKRLADRTREEVKFKLEHYLRLWPDSTVLDFDTLKIAGFLNTLTTAAYIKHRKLLLDLFQFAGHQGYVQVNPVAVTIAKREDPKVRLHHTEEGFQQIRAAAPAWLAAAMDLAVFSLQRADDLVCLTRSAVDLDANTLTVLQRKTRNYKNPVYLEIVMGDDLRAAVEACHRTGIPCPYLVHTRPLRMTQAAREAKPHPFAVTRPHLSKEFTRIRDKAGAYADLTPEERPTFHELRSLGMHRYEKVGFERSYIMALSGHATEAMYERYTKDYKQKAPTRVEAGMRSPEGE